MPKNALPGGEVDIGGDKPSYLRIIVTGLELIETSFLVINVSTVAEGVILSEGGSKRACG